MRVVVELVVGLVVVVGSVALLEGIDRLNKKLAKRGVELGVIVSAFILSALGLFATWLIGRGVLAALGALIGKR